jgi:hypothetical protein
MVGGVGAIRLLKPARARLRRLSTTGPKKSANARKALDALAGKFRLRAPATV